MARRRKKDDISKAANEFSRMDPRAQLAVVALIIVLGLALLFLQLRKEHAEKPGTTAPPPPAARTEPPTATPPAEAATPGGVSVGPVNMLLGNPSGATADPANKTNYLMVKPYFSLAYNGQTGTPNWVSWRVTAADLEGSAPRKQLFDPDTTLPAGFYRVTHKDYSGSGFDRGHMCPHADRDATQEMSWSTFVMTNIIPQAPNVNQGAWADLEDYCRNLVLRDHARLYIIAGPAGKGGRGSSGMKETIAAGKVTVPAECWKVIVVVASAGSTDDLANISTGTRVIAVIMPNDNEAIGRDWTKYRTSVANVEQRMGFHFFDRLPPAIATALKQKVDALPVAAAAGPTRRGAR